MNHRYRVALSRKNQAPQLPLMHTVVWWLVLDKLDAAPWVWGAWAALFVLVWLAALFDILTARQVELRG